MKLKDIITNAINECVKKHRLNQTKAARELGISRATLKKYLNPSLIKPRKNTKQIIYRDTVEL